MAFKQESYVKPNSHNEEEKKIPVFTVLKNGAILKNIFLLYNPPPPPVEESNQGLEEMLVVGRHPDCDIVLEHPSISRFHLRIHSNPSSQSISVIDLSSVHGSWISGNKIDPGVPVELKEGDKMKLGGSSREYMLHWIPISRAYDLDNPFVAPLGEAQPFEEMEEKKHQNEGGGLVQSQDSAFSDMNLLPYVTSLTPSAPPMPEEMKSLFPFDDEEINVDPPEEIHRGNEISLTQPACEPDQENNTPRAHLVPGGLQTENAESSPVRSQQRSLSIWSRRGKCSSVQIQTNRDRAVIEKVDIDTEIHSLNHEKVATESVSNDPFSCGNKDDEDTFTPDKENHAPSSLSIWSEKSSCLADGQGTKPMLSSCMDENGEENFTPEKVDLSANTHPQRSTKKMSRLEQIKNPRPFISSPINEIFDPILQRSEVLEDHMTEIAGPHTILSNMSEDSEQIFIPDKENMTPDSCSMRLKKNGKTEEDKHPKPFEKEKLIGEVLDEHKSATVTSRNKVRSAVTVLKNTTDRVPFQSLLVNSPSNTNSKSPEQKVKLNANPIKCREIVEDNNAREEKRRWIMVVDITSLLNKESRKALQLLQGLKGTCLIIPRTVLRELESMKRRASFFRRATEVSTALEWIEDCMANAKSWVHVQSSMEETRPMAPTPPATAPPCLFDEENGIFPVGSVLSSPHWGLAEIVSPTAEDHILECALSFKRKNRDGLFVILSNDLTMKIKAMAEGLNCETAEDFRESLVNPFSERFLWKDSSPRGSTWSCVDDYVLGESYYLGPLKKPSKSGQAAKGLKLILLHNSHYRKICSGSTIS